MPDIDENTFESAVAEMAVSSLKAVSPILADYLMGFQLMDRSDDDTRAAGFFGFKVGGRWVYGPVFFLAGQIQGLELMYALDEDRMLPLEEGWVSYLTKRNSIRIGEPKRNPRGMSTAGPDMEAQRRPPTYKHGADKDFMVSQVAASIRAGTDSVAPWAKEALEALKNLKPKDMPERLSLPKAAAEFELTTGLMKQASQCPELAEALFTYYTADDYLNAHNDVQKSASTAVRAPTVKKAADKVKIFNRANTSEARTLDENSKKKLMRGEVVVTDARDPGETSSVYRYDTTVTLENPGQGGMYDMLTADLGTAKVLILEPAALGYSASKDIRLVVDPATQVFRILPTTSIYTTKQYERSEFEKELAALGKKPEAKAFSVPDNAYSADEPAYIVVTEGGQAIVPFKVVQKYENQNDSTTLLTRYVIDSYQVDDFIGRGRRNNDWAVEGMDGSGPIGRKFVPFDAALVDSAGAINISPDGTRDWQQEKCNLNPRIILTDKQLAKPVTNGSTTLLSTKGGCRVFQATQDQGVLDPSTNADIFLGIQKVASRIKVFNDGLQLYLTDDKGTQKLSDEHEALDVFMRGIGMTEQDARTVYREAKTAAARTSVRYWVKKAYAYADEERLSTDPMIDAMIQPSRGPIELSPPEYQSETDPQAYRYEKGENNYNEMYAKDIQRVNRAAASGQKDIFDSAALGTLIELHDPSAHIDSFLGDLVNGVDKLGRTLFLLYWHHETLVDQYGERALSELKDDIKSVFSQLGNVVLSLQEKSPTDVEAFGMGLLSSGAEG